MPTKSATPKKKSAKKQLHESLSEKIMHMLSDVSHSVSEIPFRKMVKKAAGVITDAIHPGKKKEKKAKKKAKKAAGKTPKAMPVKKAVIPVAVKKAAAKKTAKKTAKKK